LIMKVKKLEKIIKSTKARRRAKIVVSDDKDATQDTSKQGRKIDAINQDPDISLVQHDEDAVEVTSKQGRKIDAIDQDPDISLVQRDAEILANMLKKFDRDELLKLWDLVKE
nr:hypothetical protein [Tanacetum cinerariifolium]